MRRFIFRAVVLCIGIILLASACGYCLFAENADADHLSSMLRMQREKDEHLRRRYEAMKKAIGEVAAKRRVYQEITQREKQLKSDETGAILFSKQKKTARYAKQL
ncbi:MAG: hypothetical protein L6416_02475 [Candidatus Omnitrophica bacterium]|nr:hypothetical protein [Candidatus Omnitrophota bacterium]